MHGDFNVIRLAIILLTMQNSLVNIDKQRLLIEIRLTPRQIHLPLLYIAVSRRLYLVIVLEDLVTHH